METLTRPIQMSSSQLTLPFLNTLGLHSVALGNGSQSLHLLLDSQRGLTASSSLRFREQYK